jgi:nucleoside-diphosphate-sugar epimerase
LILGCGYTGRRVARTLAAAGHSVWATSRRPEDLDLPGIIPLRVEALDPASLEAAAKTLPTGLAVLHSIPLIQTNDGWLDPTPRLLDAMGRRWRRVVYLSTTGVYGAASYVDEHTPPAPRSQREHLRLTAENTLTNSGLSCLVLRPAAIYGPGRGVHVSIAAGNFRLLEDGQNFVSRIHVDDLSALGAAGLQSELQGRYPVADEYPCKSIEIAEFCARLLGKPMPASAARSELGETRRNNRQVDGSAILRLLGHRLRYPTYHVGVPASLAEQPG